MRKPIRIRVTDILDARACILIEGREIRCTTAFDRPIKLSDLAHGQAAGVRFALEDTHSLQAAVRAVAAAIARKIELIR